MKRGEGIHAALIGLALFVSACRDLNVVTTPGTAFPSDSYFAVRCDSDDPLRISNKIEQELLDSGFDVISIQLVDADIAGREFLVRLAEQVPDERPLFVLRFDYVYKAELPGEFYFTRFKAKIVDANSGDVNVTADYSARQLETTNVSRLVTHFVKQFSGYKQ